MYLLSSANQLGTGQTFGKATHDRAFILVENGANTANVSLLVSPNEQDHYLAFTAWTLTPGVTATAQIIDMYFPYVRAQINWLSGGACNVNVIYREMGGRGVY